jgi:glycosyltransferase involved in cell wall biosynthesis
LKNILIVTYSYPPNQDGISEASHFLANQLAVQECQVVVATGSRALAVNDANTQIQVQRFDLWNSYKKKELRKDEIKRFQAFLKQQHWNLIIFECWDAWGTELALPVIKQLKAKKVMISHGLTTHERKVGPPPYYGFVQTALGILFSLKIPFIMRLFDHVVFLHGEGDWKRFLDVRWAKITGFKKWSVIPNGVCVEKLRSGRKWLREKYGLGKSLLVLCVANYEDRKNQKLTLDIFQRANINGAYLCFIGSKMNSYSDELKQQVTSDNNQQSCFFESNLSRAEVCAAIGEADILILTAKKETQPIVLIEAMAAGVPFISTPTGCVQRSMRGGIVASGAKKLAMLLREIAGNELLRKSLGEIGKEQVEKEFDSKLIADRYRSLIDSLI